MTEFIVPGALAAAATIGIAGFLMWRRPLVSRASTAPVNPAPASPAYAPREGTDQRSDGESIVIDPVAMKIFNRVAAGSRQSGVLHCEGGVIVEGTIDGEVHVSGGPFVLMPNGVVAGKVVCDGEAYLFGTVRARSDTELSDLDVAGAVFLTETLRAQANITAGAIKSYDGAQVEGRIKTVGRARG